LVSTVIQNGTEKHAMSILKRYFRIVFPLSCFLHLLFQQLHYHCILCQI